MLQVSSVLPQSSHSSCGIYSVSWHSSWTSTHSMLFRPNHFFSVSIVRCRFLKYLLCLPRIGWFYYVPYMWCNADAKRILLASPLADWRRQLGRPRIMWLSTVQQDLKQHHLTLPEAADLAQNRPLWRMMSTYGATQSVVACQKQWQRRIFDALNAVQVECFFIGLSVLLWPAIYYMGGHIVTMRQRGSAA